jgi:phage replication-related protein YjqB (UPF0714/DUF867 family)
MTESAIALLKQIKTQWAIALKVSIPNKNLGEIKMVIDLDSRTTSFQQRVKEIAEQEWRFFCRGQRKEEEYGYYQRVCDYWREGVGIGYRDGRDTQYRWSAAFISWVMKKAGAGDKFKYSSWHSDYIIDAIEKRDDPSASFKGYRLTEIAPKVGDLVCFSSGEDRGEVDYNTRKRYRSHCDVVVATRAGKIDVIGGNVHKSVYLKTLNVDPQGYLIDNTRCLIEDTECWFVVIQNLLQLDSNSEIMTSYNAKVKNSLDEQFTLKSNKEHCSAHPDKLATIDRAVGNQIRIKRNENEYALYTVSETRQEEPDNILRMTDKARSRLGTTYEFDAIVESKVPYATYKNEEADEEAAKRKNEFIECLNDNGTHTGLIVIAPHGGAIEEYTDRQAEYLADQLQAQGVSCWRCKGWKRRQDPNRGAYDCWHITSTDIHEASFPLLNTVINRGFTYAVAFHGFSDENNKNKILIGGAAGDALKQKIKIAIQNAIAPSDIDVKIATSSSHYGGDNPKNIVNRLANCNGIQIEQSKTAREQYWQKIAEAVASVYRDKI